jgi:5-formyltetrahydrofolate cyclo-ligase
MKARLMSDLPISDPSKLALRKRALTMRASLPMASLSPLLCQQIALHATFLAASRVLFYHPIRTEPDLRPLAHQFPEKKWFLPVMKPNNCMTFHPYHPHHHLRQGPHGIWEPDASQESLAITPALLQPEDIMILPGLLFDRSGYRLGYGQGNFDRFLGEALQKGTTCLKFGAVPAVLLWDSLPREKWDLPVNWLVTEQETLQCDAENTGPQNFNG